MSGDTLEFDQIYQENKGAMYDGRLRISKQGIVFKNNKTGKVDNLAGTDLNLTHWFRVARGYELKVGLKSGAVFKYDGFKESDFDKLSDFINKNYKMHLEEKELSVKGWNWGTAKFKGPLLSFDIDNMSAFEIPLGNVSHCATSKNEVALEFHQNDDADVSLMEMRFYVPPNQENPDIDPVQAFHDNVMDKADIIQATGDAICIFKELQCLTPRGRYDVRIYPTFLHLHGKTFDYKLPYTTVLRLFLLPHKDQRQMFFVVSLDPPIKQGQTRYHFLILQFSKDEDMTLELSLSEEDCADKFEGKLQKEMSGPVYEIVSRVMKSMVNRKITVPGGFKGNSGTSAVSCSHKAGAGFLYPLERGFIYVHKPPIHLRFDEISCVNFARGVASNRTFDFEIETKSGTTYTFSSIEKEEYGKLFDFTTNKKLRVKNRGKNLLNQLKDSVNYDEDMMGSDDDAQHDAYMERVKAEAAEGISDEDESSDDEEEDADFNPDGSGSDIAEEYDSNASISSSDDDEEDEEKKERRKKKLEKAKNKPAKRKRASDGGRKRKKRQKKDPNAPKKAMTAFMLWLNATRSDLRKENPDASIGEIGKIAGEKWREMGPSDKEEWEQKAKEDKERYKAAMEEYEARKAEEGSSGGEESDQSEKKSKKTKSSRPKPSPTKSPSKAGSGANYKSKEYISSDSDSDSSNSDSDSEEKEKKAKKKGKKAKKKSEDEEEEPTASTPPESEESASGGEEEEDEEDD